MNRLSEGEPLLVKGGLEYLENQQPPIWKTNMDNGLYTFNLEASGGRQPVFHLPWSTCNGETDWQIHLNPTIPSNICATSGRGNIKIDLTGMVVTSLVTDKGGGNMEVILPDAVENLSVLVRTVGATSPSNLAVVQQAIIPLQPQVGLAS